MSLLAALFKINPRRGECLLGVYRLADAVELIQARRMASSQWSSSALE